MFNGEKNEIQLSLIINLIINLLQLITMPTYVFEKIFCERRCRNLIITLPVIMSISLQQTSL